MYRKINIELSPSLTIKLQLSFDFRNYSASNNVYPSGAPEFTPVISGVRVTLSLVMNFDFPFVRLFGVRQFCYYPYFVDRCLSFCPFLLANVLSVLQITDSDYPFGIFKLLSEGSKRFGFFLGSCCDFRCYVHIKRCSVLFSREFFFYLLFVFIYV
jgi:hypothetical protein